MAFVWSQYALPPALAALFIFGLGVYVLLKEKASRISLAFSSLTSLAGLWLFFFSLAYSSSAEGSAFFWIRCANMSVAFIPASFFLFTLTATGRFHRLRPLFFISVFLSLGFFLCIAFTRLFLKGALHYFWGYYAHYGLLSFLFLSYFFLILVLSLRCYWADYKTQKGIKKKRSLVYLIAFSIAHLACVDYFAAYGISVYPFGYCFVIVFTTLMVVGIDKYRLIRITPSFAASQILKTMADPLLLIDGDGMIRVFNDSALAFFKKTELEMNGKPAWTTGIIFLRKENLARSLWAGKSLTCEDVYIDQSGRSIPIEISYSAIRDKSGHPVASVCILKDITTRKKSETALADREKHYRLLAENISDVIWTMNGDLKVTYLSPSITRLTGHSPEEGMKLKLEQILTPPSCKIAAQVLSEERRKPYPEAGMASNNRTLELECQTKSGGTIFVEVKLTFLRDGPAQTLEIIGVARDVSERKKAEAAIKESRHSYSDILKSATEPILTVNRLGIIQYLNPAGEKLLGYSSAELAGKHFEGYMAPDSVSKTLQEFTLILLGWKRQAFDICFKRKNGDQVWLEVTPNLIRRYEEESLIQAAMKETGSQDFGGGIRQSA